MATIPADEAPIPEVPLERPLRTIEAIIPQTDFLPEAREAEEEQPDEPVLADTAQPDPQAAQSETADLEPDPAQPRVILPKKKPSLTKEVKPPIEKIVHAKQEVLQFESITRGRFEKSEPTIIEGQDLDVPTFLRKNVRVK